jgi:hypothetical protein
MMLGRNAGSTQDRLAVLNCRRLPGRVNTSEAALLLGLQEHDIAPLISAKLLEPLGKPAPNAPKYFASVEIVARAESPAWLSDATKTLAKHWLGKISGNARWARWFPQRSLDRLNLPVAASEPAVTAASDM